MPDEQQPAIHDPAVHESQAPVYDPVEEGDPDDWFEDSDYADELPPRPRRRLLGAGGNPILLALLAALLIAGGFIGGVEVQKGEEGTSATTGGAASGLASRFAGLRGTGTGTGTGAGAGAGAGTAAGKTTTGGGAGGGFTGAGAGGARPTTGTVAYVAGNTLYVTNAEGNTVKVNTSAATNVSKTVKSKLASIFPGETVTITGSTGSGGAVSAESISVGSGGLSALFGGSGKAGTSTGTGGGGGPALFGSG
jgi:hypothetical protein